MVEHDRFSEPRSGESSFLHAGLHSRQTRMISDLLQTSPFNSIFRCGKPAERPTMKNIVVVDTSRRSGCPLTVPANSRAHPNWGMRWPPRHLPGRPCLGPGIPRRRSMEMQGELGWRISRVCPNGTDYLQGAQRPSKQASERARARLL